MAKISCKIVFSPEVNIDFVDLSNFVQKFFTVNFSLKKISKLFSENPKKNGSEGETKQIFKENPTWLFIGFWGNELEEIEGENYISRDTHSSGYMTTYQEKIDSNWINPRENLIGRNQMKQMKTQAISSVPVTSYTSSMSSKSSRVTNIPATSSKKPPGMKSVVRRGQVYWVPQSRILESKQ